MTFLEKNLEDILYETPNEKLTDRGLPVYGFKRRQVRVGNYGIADLVTLDREGWVGETVHFTITVYELKKDKIDANAMMQAFRYCTGINRYLRKRLKSKSWIAFKVILVGKEICLGDFCYLTDFIHQMDVFTYSYNFDGITFKSHAGYVLSNEGFDL